MNRLQISLTQEHYDFLKAESFTSGKSMAAVLRALLDEVIAARRQDLLENDPIWRTIGVGAEIDGPTDISSNVDRYLYGERVESNTLELPLVAEDPDEYTSD
jgi:hypothetical protein